MNRRVKPRVTDPELLGRRRWHRGGFDFTGLPPWSEQKTTRVMLLLYVIFAVASIYFWYEILFVGLNWFKV